MEAGFLEEKSSTRCCSVSPLSMMSSTMMTCRSIMLVSRSLIRRTMPEDCALSPYAGDGDKVGEHRAIHGAAQIGKEKHGAFKDTDHQRVFVLIFLGELLSDFTYASGDLFFGK